MTSNSRKLIPSQLLPKTTQMGVIFTNHCTVTAQLKGPPEGFEEDCDKMNPPRHFVARFDEIPTWNRGFVGYSPVVPINPKNAVLLK